MKRTIDFSWMVLLLGVVVLVVSSCNTVKSGCPNNVSHWERTHRFKA